MSSNKFEKVSAMVDGHHCNDDNIRQLLDDKEMAEGWQRYHLVGDVLRGEASEQLDIDISAQISAALEDEPTILAPQSWQQRAKAQVIAFAKPVGQVAIAASAAFVMILGVQHTNQPEELQEVPQIIQPIPFGGVADPVSYNVERSMAAERKAYIEQKRRLHAILNDHKQQLRLHNIEQYSDAKTQQSEQAPEDKQQ